MYRYSLPAFILIALQCLACQSKQTSRELPVPEEQLVKVLADIHLAEVAGHNLFGLKKDSVEALYYRQIFTIHQIDSADFFHSMELLRKEPEHMRAVYDQVIELLGKMEADEKPQKKSKK